MPNFCIISNNPMVCEKYPRTAKFHDVPVKGILTIVRDAVHRGAVLISHPMSGSIKPNESPYKSVVMSDEKGELHMGSLQTIEDAIVTLRKFREKNLEYDEGVLEDFAVIDLDLMDSAMSSLPHEYYV